MGITGIAASEAAKLADLFGGQEASRIMDLMKQLNSSSPDLPESKNDAGVTSQQKVADLLNKLNTHGAYQAEGEGMPSVNSGVQAGEISK